MKTYPWVASLLLVLGGTAQAAAYAGAPDRVHYSDLERVDRIHVFGSLNGWRPIDRDTLIIWATPFQPYLVDLSRQSLDLRFANVIGVTSTLGTVYQKFDRIIVNGLPYRIEAIYRLDRKTANHMKRIS